MTDVKFTGFNTIQNVKVGIHEKAPETRGFVGAEGFEPPTLCL